MHMQKWFFVQFFNICVITTYLTILVLWCLCCKCFFKSMHIYQGWIVACVGAAMRLINKMGMWQLRTLAQFRIADGDVFDIRRQQYCSNVFGNIFGWSYPYQLISRINLLSFRICCKSPSAFDSCSFVPSLPPPSITYPLLSLLSLFCSDPALLPFSASYLSSILRP